MSTGGEKPFDASFGHNERYTATGDDPDVCAVIVEGTVCIGHVIATNGPRVHVRFSMQGSTYVRWFDRDELLDAEF